MVLALINLKEMRKLMLQALMKRLQKILKNRWKTKISIQSIWFTEYLIHLVMMQSWIENCKYLHEKLKKSKLVNTYDIFGL